MSSSVVLAGKEKSLIFETILCSPGMTEKCKIIIALSRQNILLLCRLIEGGFIEGKEGFGDEILSALPKEGLQEFKTLHEEVLKKAELTEFYQKLKLL